MPSTESCPGCGSPVKPSKSYKCMCCGKNLFCSFCVDVIHGRHYCEDCIENRLVVKCPDCGKRVKYSGSHECAKTE